jgi:hypothetical protein
MRATLLALSILIGCVVDTSAQSTTIDAVPAALSKALAEYRCVPHTAAEAEVMRNRETPRRWWISLEPYTGGDADFAFYCQISVEKRLSRLVVVVRGEKNPWQGCNAVVASYRERVSNWFPYDLAVVSAGDPRYSRHMDLGRWWLVSSAGNLKVTYGPAGVKVPNPIIDTIGNMGAGSLYACYSGQWYRIGLD